MLLSKGTILLIAGGVLIVAGFSIFGYYTFKFVTDIQGQNNYSIEPEKSIVVNKLIENTGSQQGAYFITFDGSDIQQLQIKLTGPQNNTILERTVSPPGEGEAFPVTEAGNYVLTVTNLSDERVGVSAALLDQTSLLDSNTPIVISSSIVFAGIAVIIAGIVVALIDRKRKKQMKRFGDNSDLV